MCIGVPQRRSISIGAKTRPRPGLQPAQRCPFLMEKDMCSKPASCQPWNPGGWKKQTTEYNICFVLRKIGEGKNFEFQVPETNPLPTGELPTCFLGLGLEKGIETKFQVLETKVTGMSPGQVEFHWFPNGRQRAKARHFGAGTGPLIKKNSAFLNLCAGCAFVFSWAETTICCIGENKGFETNFSGETNLHTTLSWRFPNWLPEEVCSWVGNLPTGQKSSFWKENIQLKCAQEALVSLSQTNLFARFRTFVFCRKTSPTKTRKQQTNY